MESRTRRPMPSMMLSWWSGTPWNWCRAAPRQASGLIIHADVDVPDGLHAGTIRHVHLRVDGQAPIQHRGAAQPAIEGHRGAVKTPAALPVAESVRAVAVDRQDWLASQTPTAAEADQRSAGTLIVTDDRVGRGR